MIVTFGDKAEVDFEDISDWIALDNPLRADSFVEELLERCLSLSEHSARFPVVRRFATFELRKMTHGDYLVFYAILSDRVEVARIVHGARDWASLFD